MRLTDTNKLYAADDILSKLERALEHSSGDVTADIQAAIDDRKAELRNG